jgi:hypothetical protein
MEFMSKPCCIYKQEYINRVRTNDILLSRIEWYFKENPSIKGHGDWIPRKEAMDVVTYYNLHSPLIRHVLINFERN